MINIGGDLRFFPMPTSVPPTRRRFLQTAVPFIVSAATLGRAGAVSPNGKVRLACIGVGGQGTSNLRALMADERVQVVAICDVDSQHAAAAAKLAGVPEGSVYKDFREVLARSDVDWRRSGMKVRMACERVRNGYIGELKEIEIGVPGKFAIRGGYTGLEMPEAVPAHLDYAMWLGPAAEKPYTAARCHFNFRWIEEYAPGYITDWGAHFLDVAQWGAGMDETTPTEVSATEVKRRSAGIYDAAESFRIEYQYNN
ncbi:MAG: hypothetical protein B7Z55_13370, partial [Planctomycetales bacterium 12-60-4]